VGAIFTQQQIAQEEREGLGMLTVLELLAVQRRRRKLARWLARVLTTVGVVSAGLWLLDASASHWLPSGWSGSAEAERWRTAFGWILPALLFLGADQMRDRATR
jgi:hypothetical protein